MKHFVCLLLGVAAFAAKPVQVVVLKSSQLEVTFDPIKGLPAEYRLLSNKATIRGAAGNEVAVTVYSVKTRTYTGYAVRPELIRSNKNRADFQFTVREKGVAMSSFLLRYELTGAQVQVSLEAVLEEQGFELIDVGLPNLASVREEDGGAWLAHGDGGGTVAMLNRAKPGHLHLMATTLPVAMVGTNRMLCAEEVTSYMDTTELAVENHQASVGTVKTWRVNGGHALGANSSTPNLMVGGRPLCKLDFAGDVDHNGVVDWLDAAKLLRERMPAIPTHYYDDRVPYKILCDEAKLAKPAATFEDSGKVIRRIAALTGGAPQNVYLWGWQYRGRDTGFPAVAEVNQRLGGFEGFQKLQQSVAGLNATISFSDDYEVAYQNSPAWDSNLVARQPDGQLWALRDAAYLLGLAKYMDGPGPERIRYTGERYKIRESYFIDGLSSNALRNDWDREHPASGVTNLEARYQILEGFKKLGLDVASDELRYSTIGKISLSAGGPSGEDSPFGGQAVPLAAAIYRKSALWGMRGTEWKKHPLLASLFYNGHEFPVLPQEDWEREFTAFYYQRLVPWYQVHTRNIESFLRDGERTVLGLEGNARIDLDWSRDDYTVSLNGVDVARDGDTFCPLGKDRVAFYSRSAKELSAGLPEGWIAGEVTARSLPEGGAAQVSVRDGKLVVRVQAEKPVMVYRDAAAR